VAAHSRIPWGHLPVHFSLDSPGPGCSGPNHGRPHAPPGPPGSRRGCPPDPAVDQRPPRLAPHAALAPPVRALGLAHPKRAPEGHGVPLALAQARGPRPAHLARPSAPARQRVPEPRHRLDAPRDDPGARSAADPHPATGRARRRPGGRGALPVPPSAVPLPRLPGPGGREPPVPRRGPRRAAAGLPPVRRPRLAARRARCLYRVGRGGAAREAPVGAGPPNGQRGVCYQAANWVSVGQTQGRSRNDRRHRLRVAPKAVYLYPLTPRSRERLRGG
jgi:hypothetical protein